MGGYAYGESEPFEECPCCGGRAYAEFCDVGVGMVQIEPYRCSDCGASEKDQVKVEHPDGTWSWTWQAPPKPSERGERVTGHLIRPNGYVFETTFDEDHSVLASRMRTTMSALVAGGSVRITVLEGFCIDIPPFMTAATRQSLKRVLDSVEGDWGLPYVRRCGDTFGREMPCSDVMKLVSRLPTGPDALASSIEEEMAATRTPAP